MDKEENQKRSRLETMNVILNISVDGIKKTHIMYRANLSHQQLEKYLTILFDKELLAIKEGGYTTTQRGYLFIRKFDELVNFMNNEESPHIVNAHYIQQ